MQAASRNWLCAPALLLMVVAAALCRWRSGSPFRLWPVLGSTLLFGLLGPPIGGLVTAIAVATIRPDVRVPEAWALFMLASYLVALVPALVGGACAGLLRAMLGPGARLAVVAACCGLASGLFAYGLLTEGGGGVALMMAGLGALSGVAIEAALLGWESWRNRAARAPEYAEG
jgi:hypothetical protein